MTSKYETHNNRDRRHIDPRRYVAVSDETGNVVVYDTLSERAWLKSDTALDLAGMV